MNIAYPLRIDQNGLLASTTEEQHIEQMIEQLLFTLPGERVNMPDFGTGLLHFVFNTGTTEVTSALQLLVQGALQQWLGNLIQVQVVQIVANDASLNILVSYVIKRTRPPVVSQLTRRASSLPLSGWVS